MSAIVPQARLRADLDLLADLVGSLEFRLESPGQEDRRARRDHLLAVSRRYLEPRLADPGHPLVVAVFGPTGSGKSTIVNTLAGRDISPVGVLRPTTERAVAWVHRRHVEAARRTLGDGVELIEDEHPALESLVLVDTPDIDSVASDHRDRALDILAAADVALAVTTPQRYADAVPWEVIGELTGRALRLTVVMNRASRRSSGAVIDLAGLLRDARVGGVESSDDIVVIQEQRIRGDGRLHGYALRRLARRLQDLASDRGAVVRRGVLGAARHCVVVADEVAADVKAQDAEGGRLLAVVDDAIAAARGDITSRLRDGDLVRAEVVARWQTLIGVSDLAAGVSAAAARIRRLLSPASGTEDLQRVDREIVAELVEAGMEQIARALRRVDIAWSTSATGRTLVEAIDADTEALRRDLTDAIAGWRAELVRRVSEVGQGRIRRSRAASYGINGVATLVLLALFTSTGGLTGAEVGVAAGAAAAQQALLERLLGTAEVRRLEKQMREDLVGVVESQVARALTPHRAAVDGAVDDPDLGGELADAARRVEAALEEYAGG
ncbi:MAG: dynamin family protein [Acidimicrobiia bacterium]|nr:dynamin family protein [Acidimicrobiia bacterium]